MKTTTSHIPTFPGVIKMIMLLVCILGFLSCLLLNAQPGKEKNNHDSFKEGLAYRNSEQAGPSALFELSYLLPSINSIYVKALPNEIFPVEVVERSLELKSWMIPAGKSGWDVKTSVKLPDFLVEEADEELVLEPWMMDFKLTKQASSFEFLEEIEDEELRLEDWMLDHSFIISKEPDILVIDAVTIVYERESGKYWCFGNESRADTLYTGQGKRFPNPE